MIIAHLSDMHVGSQFQPDVFDVLLEEINSIKPDAVVITGDLTNQGLVKEFEECKRLISRFKTEKLITMSGNHDYRNTGYLLFKKYFPFDHVNEIGKDVVIVTVSTSRPDRNDGEIGYRQALWLEKTMEIQKRIKIVAMHHHLSEYPIRVQRATVTDGRCTPHYLDTDVNAVLCGHKHRPWLWQEKGLQILQRTVLSGAWMADYLGEKHVRDAIFDATWNVINEGKYVTSDIGGSATTTQMAKAISEIARKNLKK